MFHQPVFSQLFNVGVVNFCSLRVHSDHIAAVALLNKVQNHVLADPAKRKKCMSWCIMWNSSHLLKWLTNTSNTCDLFISSSTEIVLDSNIWMLLPEPFSPSILFIWFPFEGWYDNTWPVPFRGLLDIKVLVDVLHATPGQQVVSCCEVERCLGITLTCQYWILKLLDNILVTKFDFSSHWKRR